MEDLFLDMPVEQAQDFVKKRIAIVESASFSLSRSRRCGADEQSTLAERVAEFDEPIARLKEEHAKVRGVVFFVCDPLLTSQPLVQLVETLQSAFGGQSGQIRTLA